MRVPMRSSPRLSAERGGGAVQPEDSQQGWQNYFGFRIPPERIMCDGCMAENPRLIDNACPVRPCAIQRRVGNCSECPDCVCEKLADRLVVYEDLAAKHAHSIPAEDRARFIRPYENKERLEHLKAARGAPNGAGCNPCRLTRG